MELLGDVGEMEAPFGLFGDSVNLNVGYVHALRRTYHRPRKSFWMHPMVLLCDVGLVEAHFGQFGDSVNLSAR